MTTSFETASRDRLQREILARIAGGARAQDVLSDLCRMVEEALPGTTCRHAHRGPPARTSSAEVEVRREGTGSTWVLPLPAPRGEVLGTFTIANAAPDGPAEHDLTLLRTVAQLASIVLERERVERMVSEQGALLESVVESTEDPVFAKDRDGRYLLANAADARGIRADTSQVLGCTDKELYPPEVARVNRQSDLEVLSTGRSLLYEQEYDNPQEGRRTFLIRKSPLIGSDGSPRGVIGIARDITARKRAEEALRRAQKLESLGVLAGGIAHDFNNLLTGILGNAELALATPELDPEVARAVEEIRRSASRAADLTSQMLAYSGGGELVKTVLSLPAVVGEVAELLSSSISKKAELRFEFEHGLPNIEADPTQVRQLVMNLITNASEALEGMPGRILVSMAVSPPPPDASPQATPGDSRPLPRRFVRLSIEDDGIGMSDEVREKIFDPFFTTKLAGRGLGLAAVQGIVRDHGGTIEVESRPGRGTSFVVHLPASEESVTDPERPEPAPPWNGRGKVLVVDDEEAIRQLARRILERVGMETVLARDGTEAVEILRRDPQEIAVVLLDLTTPRLSGFQAFESLRRVRSDVRVILTSGYCERDALAEFEGRELNGFLQKPFGPSDLTRLVQRALAQG